MPPKVKSPKSPKSNKAPIKQASGDFKEKGDKKEPVAKGSAGFAPLKQGRFSGGLKEPVEGKETVAETAAAPAEKLGESKAAAAATTPASEPDAKATDDVSGSGSVRAKRSSADAFKPGPLPKVAPGKVPFFLGSIAPYVTCILCEKYFNDATTISECLHTFCKACIEPYMEDNRRCPKCFIPIEKTGTMIVYRADQTLQDLVDKIERTVESAALDQAADAAEAEEDQELIEDEGRSRKRTARGPPKSGSEQEKTAREQLKQASQREDGGGRIRVQLKYDTADAVAEETGPNKGASPPGRSKPLELSQPGISVSDGLTVFDLKQFLQAAFPTRLRSVKQVEVRCNGVLIGDDMSLQYVLQTHWRGRGEDLLLQYRRLASSSY